MEENFWDPTDAYMDVINQGLPDKTSRKIPRLY